MKNKRLFAIIIAVMMLCTTFMGALTVMGAAEYTAVSPSINSAGLGAKEKLEVDAVGGTNPNVTYTLTLGDIAVYSDGKTYGEADQVTGATAVNGKVLGTVTYNAGDVVGLGNVERNYTINDGLVAAINALSFDRPGIYYWPITKTVSDNSFPNNQKSSVSTYGTALVIRVDDNSGVLTAPAVSINVLDANGKPTGNKDATYEDTFTNAPGALIVKNEVTGNQGARDQYFKYEIELTGMGLYAGQTITPIGDNTVKGTTPKYGEGYDSAVDNLTGVRIGDDGTATFTVWLKEGEEIEIPNIPQSANVKYTITESKHDGYDVSTSHTDPNDSSKTIPGTGDKVQDVDLNPDGSRVVFKNDKQTAVPTGVIMAVAPAFAIIAIGGIGAGIVFAGKRRDEDEEE